LLSSWALISCWRSYSFFKVRTYSICSFDFSCSWVFFCLSAVMSCNSELIDFAIYFQGPAA
jgi:hypothetical protein